MNELFSNPAHSIVATTLALALAACGPVANLSDATTDGDVATSSDASDATSAADTNTGPYDPYFDPAMHSPSTPITAPSEEWTWVPFGDAVCGNGESTGIGVNLTTRSNRVLIFMMGGGACWDQATCYVVQSAANLTDGYTATDFAHDTTVSASTTLFDRSDARNPFRDYNWVFVPYCTGDVHTGNMRRSYVYNGTPQPTFFMGGRNMSVYLRRIVPTFASADRVILSGASAGGFGAALNWERVQTAFGATRVDLLDDSGPPIDNSRYHQWVSTWNTEFPTGCTECANTATAALTYYTARYATGHRFALLSYEQDATIAGFYGFTGAQFETGLYGIAHDFFDPNPWIHYFFLPGSDHVLIGGLATTTGADGTTLSQFINQMVTDDPAWHSVHP